jgi:predicted AAA+ superfamily ATPase
MAEILRLLQLPDTTKHSVFLWGPRKVGKSSWLRKNLKGAHYIDLLKSDVFVDYSSRPSLLRERYSDPPGPRKVIIIDEIQKCPPLLDEVHWLIENRKQPFVLTGSSARKLRRAGVNMLGGRARRREMRPLCYGELKKLDLQRAMISGLLPSHYLSDDPEEDLRGYIADYIKEEIAIEADIQSLPAFAEFLRVASITNAELLNYANVGREAGAKAKDVRDYFQILEDTLLGFRIKPWGSSKNRRLVETEKFYLFDVGVCNFLARRKPLIGSGEFGKSFEHLILMELLAYRAYRSPDLDIYFWRTANKQEVDFILNDRQVAIEIKASSRIHATDARYLKLLSEDGPVGRRIVISMEQEPKRLTDSFGPIDVLPWNYFFDQLWAGDIIT